MSDLRVNIGVTGAQQAAQALTSVEQKLNQTAKAGSKTSDALSRLPNASGAATQSLVNLSRVAQDAPFGFIGIANNLNPLFESFTRLKEQTGSSSNALKALKESLMGPAGVGLAIGVVSSLLITFGDKLFSFGNTVSKQAQLWLDAKEAFTQAATSVATLRNEIDFARQGLINKEQFLNKYNETIGKTIGQVKSLDEAEAELTRKGPAYIAMTFQKAVANLALQKAAEAAFQELLLQRFADSGEFGSGAAEKGVKTLQRQKAAFQEIGLEAQALATNLAKFFGLDVFEGKFETKVKEVTVTPNKVKLTNPRTITFDNVRESDVEAPLELFSNLRNQTDAFNAIIGKPKEADGFAFPTEQEVKAIDNALRELTQTGLVVGQVFADAFGALTEALFTGQNAIKAFANAFIQSLTQVISKLIQTAILAAIVSAISGGGTAIGAASNKFGDIFKFLLGFGGASGRASGGGVVPGGGYPVGENGPEWFVPSVPGRIIPTGQLNSPLMMGGGMSGGRVVIRGRELRLLGIRTQNSQIRLSGR